METVPDPLWKPEKSFWKLQKAGKAQKDNEKWWKPENQKKSHGKLEKVGISCGNPETDPLLPPFIGVFPFHRCGGRL